MKKIIVLLFFVILIPYFIVTLFISEQKANEFQFGSNLVVRVKREKTGEIEEVPFESYVLGVLAGEMPIRFHEEALKAQAVAARSYVLKKMEANQDKEYDIVDTVMNQVYLDTDYLKNAWKEDYSKNIEKLKKVIFETTGEYLSYEGDVIEAFFFSTSTGMTENSGEVFQKQLPYLVSVKSEWDQDVSPVFQENVTLSLYDFYTKLGLPYNQNLKIEVTKTTSTGRVKELCINGVSFTGSEVYSKLGLRSTFFSIVKDGTNVVITTKGYGHGVGMSQWGANAMAKDGSTYDQILKHYYNGVEIDEIKYT